MKSSTKFLFVFFLLVFPWDAIGQEEVAAESETATIKAELSSAFSPQDSGAITPGSEQHQTGKDVNKSTISSFLDTLIDSRDDITESIFVEAFVQLHRSIFCHDKQTIEHSTPTDELIFPFHFFL